LAPKRKRNADGEKSARHYSGVRERTPDQGAAPQCADQLNVSAVEDASTIERLLDDTSKLLAETPDTPLRRELCLVVERYRYTLGAWSNLPPTRLQRVILIDCVRALHQRVASRSWRKLPPLE
jgi:hypothetical protein